MTTGEKIKARRLELGLTQVDLANRICVTKSYINRMEHDTCNIPLARMKALSVALSCSPAELVGDYQEERGSVIELEMIASKLSEDRIGALIQYAKFLAKEE